MILTLTCGLADIDKIRYKLKRNESQNDEDQMSTGLLSCDESSKVPLSPDSDYMLLQLFGDESCVVEEFSKS